MLFIAFIMLYKVALNNYWVYGWIEIEATERYFSVQRGANLCICSTFIWGCLVWIKSALNLGALSWSEDCAEIKFQELVERTVDNTLHFINHYPLDSVVGSVFLATG